MNALRAARVMDALADDPRWHRFGYLGARRDHPASAWQRWRADVYVVRCIGTNADRLIRWVDSRHGAWWGEVALTRGIRAADRKYGPPRLPRQYLA